MHPKYYRFSIIIGLFCILLAFLSIEHLKTDQAGEDEVTSRAVDQPVTTVIETKTIIGTTSAQKTIEDILVPGASVTEVQTELAQVIQAEYSNDYLLAQNDIVDALIKNKIGVEESGYLVLPNQPADYTETNIKQIDVPLMLQTDPQWRSLSYGTDTTGQLGENGCAIVSLAMVTSYYDRTLHTPEDVLKWSGQDYYVENQGTSWQIFYDYALSHGYQFENFGGNFERAMQALEEDRIVIASVDPGYFTQVGHILLIRGYDGQNVFVNDPNDDPEKMHSLQGIDQQILLDEGVNYWTIYK